MTSRHPDGRLIVSSRIWRIAASLALAGVPLGAQQIEWRTRVGLYFDNTEFFTPYRVGETIFGGRVTSWLDATTGSRTALHLGFSADRRWGSEQFTDSFQPVISFRYRTTHSEGILGVLESGNRHGLLDAVMAGTRELTDPIEYGGQWRELRKNFRGELWMNWQQLNTPAQREGFEMGAVISYAPVPGVSLEGQHLWSHRGGQLYDAGVPVSNNRVTAIGAGYSRTLGGLREFSVSLHYLWNEGHLDAPAADSRPSRGSGTLARIAIAPKGWLELFAQSWWGRDFSAAAGDANYGSSGHDGVFYRANRRYTEIGAVRSTEIENGITFDAGLRFHKIDQEKSIALFESSWELSYRLMVKVPLDVVLRSRLPP